MRCLRLLWKQCISSVPFDSIWSSCGAAILASYTECVDEISLRLNEDNLRLIQQPSTFPSAPLYATLHSREIHQLITTLYEHDVPFYTYEEVVLWVAFAAHPFPDTLCELMSHYISLRDSLQHKSLQDVYILEESLLLIANEAHHVSRYRRCRLDRRQPPPSGRAFSRRLHRTPPRDRQFWASATPIHVTDDPHRGPRLFLLNVLLPCFACHSGPEKTVFVKATKGFTAP